MALTSLDVANGALIKLGEQPIASLDGGSKAANACKNRLPVCRQAVLRSHAWNFAIQRTTLAASSTEPEFGYAYKSPLPSGCLRVLQVDDRRTGYRLEAGYIHADSNDIELRYVADIEDDYSLADPLFIEALSCYLAQDISYHLTNSSENKDRLLRDYDMALKRARFVDATEEPAEALYADTWINARTGSTVVAPSIELK